MLFGALRWLRNRLTRRRAWLLIAFVLVWNLVLGGILVRQMLKDDLPTAVVAQTVVFTAAGVIGVVVWLLWHSRRPPSEEAKRT
jgi:hypothetical protein